MKQSRILTALLVVGALLVICGTTAITPELAVGLPIEGPIWVVNTPAEAIVDFRHGAATGIDQHFLGSFLSPPIPPAGGGAPVSHWNVTFNATAEGRAAGGDLFFIPSAGLQHLVGPDGEGRGSEFSAGFGPFIGSPGSPRLIERTIPSESGAVLPHEEHRDRFRLNVAIRFGGPVGDDITSYTGTLVGIHERLAAPTPPTFILFGINILSMMLGYAWWRRKHAA